MPTFPDDYTGERGDFAAFTRTATYYNWQWEIAQNQPCMYIITAFDDNAYFHKNLSWFKNEYTSDTYLLNHEQKHFDITEISVRKVNEAVANEFLGKQFTCPSNGQSQNNAINGKISRDLQPIFDQFQKEQEQMDLDYDTQTNHGGDPQMQQEWDDHIANLLDYYEPFKDKQEIQLIPEEIEEQDLTPTCPPDYPYLHSDGQCWNISEESQTTKTAKYLPYQNNQYGFSIKYPSTWQKDEVLAIDEDKPNHITITTFTSPSQTALFMVGFAKNDPTYKGLNDQQILDKMKKEITNKCKECQDIEFVGSETTIHPNGYKMYYIALTTMVTDEVTLYPLMGYGIVPDGDDLWLISLVFFSQDDFDQFLEETASMEESFTIFDYEEPQQADELAQKNKDIAIEELAGKKPEDKQGGGCLIATATFGSELAPQVQTLREVRNNILSSTNSGTSFMSAFNGLYYSFSPTVSDWERQNPFFKETVKIVITPMISTLSILNYVDIDSEQKILGYGIGIILLNLGMYFVVPAIVILKIRSKFSRFTPVKN